jgi:hypothetical protein
MKQLKDIFSRKSSIWLTIELVLVTIACWWAFDPVIVTSYIIHRPMGYDTDCIVKFDVESSVDRNKQSEKWEEIIDEEEVLLQKVQEMDGVEMAYAASSTPIGFGTVDIPKFFYHNGDSLQCFCFGFNKDSRMFEVYGIQSLTPEVPTSELSHDCEEDNTIILTRSVAMKLFGTIDVAGKKLLGKELGWFEEAEEMGWRGGKYFEIRAVVEDVRFYGLDRECANAFICDNALSVNVPILARLHEGVNASRFVQTHEQEVQRDFVTKRCYVQQMEVLNEAQDKLVEDGYLGRQTRRNLLIAAFFAVNLAFGVFGTLLMYTRQRREEAGVRRAFGATRWSIFWGFIREAWLLTTVSVLLGCIIYFQFAATRGLYDNFSSPDSAIHLWFDDFGTHFLMVSAFVYLITLCTVLIGTAIPAWRICRSTITGALREE